MAWKHKLMTVAQVYFSSQKHWRLGSNYFAGMKPKQY